MKHVVLLWFRLSTYKSQLCFKMQTNLFGINFNFIIWSYIISHLRSSTRFELRAIAVYGAVSRSFIPASMFGHLSPSVRRRPSTIASAALQPKDSRCCQHLQLLPAEFTVYSPLSVNSQLHHCPPLLLSAAAYKNISNKHCDLAHSVSFIRTFRLVVVAVF